MVDKNSQGAEGTIVNKIKWFFIFLLLCLAIYANYYFPNVAWGIRAAVGIVVIIVLLLLSLLTRQGKVAFGFIRLSRQELRKVVWPTRQETVQTALMVFAFIVFASLLLWFFDSIFYWVVSWLTGQRS